MFLNLTDTVTMCRAVKDSDTSSDTEDVMNMLPSRTIIRTELLTTETAGIYSSVVLMCSRTHYPNLSRIHPDRNRPTFPEPES